MPRLCCLLLCVLLAPAVPLGAQGRPVSVFVGAGATLPVGDARSAMGPGWNVGVGATAEIVKGLGLRADYLYSRFGSDSETWQVALGVMLPAFIEIPVSAKSQMHTGSLDLVWGREVSSAARAYVMAGPSLFRRRTQLTAVVPAMPGLVVGTCAPQWLQCSPDLVPVDRALGIRTSNGFGFNVGAGIAFRTGLTALVTIEARYLHVSGPDFQDVRGASRPASATFLPLTVGLRF